MTMRCCSATDRELNFTVLRVPGLKVFPPEVARAASICRKALASATPPTVVAGLASVVTPVTSIVPIATFQGHEVVERDGVVAASFTIPTLRRLGSPFSFRRFRRHLLGTQASEEEMRGGLHH
jgi:hypothetical protein